MKSTEEAYNELAVEAMTATIYKGERDDSNVKAIYHTCMPEDQALRIEENEWLEHDLFTEAVFKAVAKFEELTGEELPVENTTWDTLEALPLFTDIKSSGSL